jgi:hypothetical protein
MNYKRGHTAVGRDWRNEKTGEEESREKEGEKRLRGACGLSSGN